MITIALSVILSGTWKNNNYPDCLAGLSPAEHVAGPTSRPHFLQDKRTVPMSRTRQENRPHVSHPHMSRTRQEKNEIAVAMASN